MSKLLVLAALLLLAAGAATAGAATRTIAVGDNYFVRATGVPTVNARTGDKVTWQWRGRKPHNVRVTRGPVRFSSPTKRSGTYSRVIRRAGTYTLICDIHGARDQKMKLVVR